MDGSNIIITSAAAEPEPPRRVYGLGAIEYDARTQRWRLRYRSKGKSLWFDTEADAIATRDAIARSGSVQEGITLREWMLLWLADHDFGKSMMSTCRALIINADPARCPPFVNWPLTTISSGDVAGWAEQLLATPKTRTVLCNGQRSTLTLGVTITRSYAKSALSALRSCLDAAKNRKPQLLKTNPAADVELPSAKSKNGKTRTKAKKRNPTKLDYLPQADCALVFFCEHCARVSGLPADDLEQLVGCPHFPFFYRVVHSVSRMQALRPGELASQCWERITWRDTDDWTGHTWLVATSWEGDTKNGQDRTQALIPMAARLLHRWWQHKGCPSSGLLFDTADASAKRPLGTLAKFVEAHPKLTNAALVDAAAAAGLALTLRRVETLRSEARRRSERKRAQAGRMFAEGYDFGWADSPYNHRKSGERRVALGWGSKLGVSTRTRQHDARDTAATHLLSGTWGVKWSLQMVSEFLGHSDIKVTQDRYAHITVEAKTQAAARVDPGRLNASGRAVSAAEIARKLPVTDPDATYAKCAESLSSGKGTRTPDQSVNRSSGEPRLRALSGENGQSPGNVLAEAVAAAQRLLEAVAAGQPLRAAALQLAGTVLDAAAPGADNEHPAQLHLVKG
jgi:integrase